MCTIKEKGETLDEVFQDQSSGPVAVLASQIIIQQMQNAILRKEMLQDLFPMPRRYCSASSVHGLKRVLRVGLDDSVIAFAQSLLQRRARLLELMGLIDQGRASTPLVHQQALKPTLYLTIPQQVLMCDESLSCK